MKPGTCPHCGDTLSGSGFGYLCPRIAPSITQSELRQLHAATTAHMPGAPFDQPEDNTPNDATP